MPTQQSKVARVIETYDLDDLGAEVEAAWTDPTGDRTSLRDLADWFNQNVLAAALDMETASQTEQEVQRLYEELTSDAAGDTVAARRELERYGIDVDTVTANFVTHQTIYTYLTEVRNATLPADDGDRTEQRIETIEKLQGRLHSVVGSTLTTLANGDELDHDEYEVLIDMQLLCPHCGATTPLKELLRTGGCSCGGGA
jgi:hypothetical protein